VQHEGRIAALFQHALPGQGQRAEVVRKLRQAALQFARALHRRDHADLHLAHRRTLSGKGFADGQPAAHAAFHPADELAQAAAGAAGEGVQRGGYRDARAHELPEAVVEALLVAQAEGHGAKFRIQTSPRKA